MRAIPALAFVLAIGLGATTPSLAAIWHGQNVYVASTNLRSERTKARALCIQQANQRKLGQNSIRRTNFLRECMRERGFSGSP
jgi:hypothetical protein